MMTAAEARLKAELQQLAQGKTPFEVALLLAEVLREVLPAQWKIKYDGNTFTIEKG